MEVSPVVVFLLIVVLYFVSSIKILAEYERGVIFRLGKLLERAKGPGVILVFRPIDRMVRVTLRTVVFDVPPQDVITRDNVSVKVNAVVYFRVVDSRRAIVEVEDYKYATSQLAQTTLRSVLGQAELDDLLSQRAIEQQCGTSRRRDGCLGHQGAGRRGQTRRSAAGHAARSPAGQSRTREAGEDHPCRRRFEALAAV
jgi:regulator of protease activity HflC (stomatin/prohibitin superfamily)